MKLFKFVTFCFAALMFAALVAGFVPPANETVPSSSTVGNIRERFTETMPQTATAAPSIINFQANSPSIKSPTGFRATASKRFNCPERTANLRLSPDNRVDETYLSPPDVLPDRTAGLNLDFNNSYFEGFGSSNRARAKI